MEKSSGINVFEVKPIRKDLGYKISAADVFNEFLYVGDEKGNLYSYPIRANDQEIISKNVNENSKKISGSRIDKIICYAPISMILVLTDEKLFAVDSALKRSEQLAAKISDFAVNESFVKEGGLYSVVAVSRKKEGFIFYYNPSTKRLQDSKSKFSVNEVPSCVGFTGNHIVMSLKKDYEVINVEKSFAVKKGVLQSKHPFLKVTNANEVLFFSEDIGIFMDVDFNPKQKDNFPVPRPITSITLCGHYCLILYEGLLQIYKIFDQKKFLLAQEIPLNNNIKGITSDRPFVFGRDDIYYLYEIPFETQVKAMVDKCMIEEALALLIQNGGDEAKVEELKMNAVWPLLRRMKFEKARDLIQSINFDVREIVLLFPEMMSYSIDSLKSKADKAMVTMVSEYVNEKASKGRDEEGDLKKKSKMFLKEVLEAKRELYIENPGVSKIKINFNSSKNSLIRPRLNAATPEELLEIIDYTLIKWFMEMKMFRPLEEFFLSNPTIYCKRLFEEFEGMIRNNDKIHEFPSLQPRFYAAFDKIEDAFEAWKRVTESQKDSIVKNACEEAVKLLTQFEDRHEVMRKLRIILKKRPEIAMGFFNMVPINFIPPDEIIRSFQQDKEDNYLELYLEIIVVDKNTQIEAYHTKLLLLYIENLFRIHPKENREEGKGNEFQERLTKMRKLLKANNSKYSSEPILRKIEKCEWLMEDEIYLYSREKRHEDALRKYISKNMSKEAEKYCLANRDQTLTIYFKMMLTMYRSFEVSKNSSALLLKKDIIIFLKRYSSNPELDPIVVLELIPEDWMLNDLEGVGGIYQFLESAITHTLHERRSTYTSKHLSETDLLNVEYNLIQAKRAYLRFTYQKRCCICQTPIADKFFVVYPNANVCHQACVKKEKNTICPVSKQDFEKTFKY